MPDIERHAPGSFSWVELATTDPKAAVTFYRALFGWDVVEHDMGPSGVYTIFTLRGADVAAAAGQHPQEREMRIPPHWKLYVTVTDADAACADVRRLGGTVEAPAFDVMEQGRMAVIQDPTGAMFNLWQPKAHIGVKICGEPGALCWSELTTRDPKKAEAFYVGLFGWTAKHSAPSAGMDYTEFTVGGTDDPTIGMMEHPPDMPKEIPSYWMPYFQVADLDATVAKAKDTGATLMVGPQPIPGTGRFAIVSDPQGAVFAAFQR